MKTSASNTSFYRKRLIVFMGFLCLIQGFWVQSQNIERVFSEGFHNDVEDLDRFTDGRWLISNISSRIPGSLSQEDLYVTILDSSASLIKQVKISHSIGEDFEPEYSLVFPDGGFLIVYGASNCDAGVYARYAEKFDSNLESVWHIQLSEADFPFLEVSPDGNILFLIGGNVEKISAMDGSLIWSSNNAQSIQEEDAILVPGTENFLVARNGKLYFYEQVIDNGDVDYYTGASSAYDIQLNNPAKLWADADSIFYLLTDRNEKLLLRFQNNFEFDTVLSLSSDLIDLASTSDKIAVLEKINDQQYEILLYDTSGLLIENYISPPSGLRPKKIIVVEDAIGVAGSYGSGPSWQHDTSYHFAGRSQGWFRLFPGFAFIDSAKEASVLITNIVQQDSIEIETYWVDPFQGYVSDFQGGDFQMEITNTGNTEVNSFWINISFSPPFNFSFCNTVEANYVLIDNVALPPGESNWYHFGDIYANHQQSYPEEFCFWTSGPNFLPDFLPDDDVYCDEGIVSTQAVDDKYLFSIYPNPADEEINVVLKGNSLDDQEWSLVDILGRRIKSGKLLKHDGAQNIDVADVPMGLYYFHSNYLSTAISIQRP